ncbi:MAG: hypothetical protein LBR98_05435 [Syntrophomonadaceae bacterium]|nr:hypothetical protein [Syntrophomonadaceae bacterium]
MILVCKSCGFLFERTARPVNCPDCGKTRIEYADIHEKITYLKRKEEGIGLPKEKQSVKPSHRRSHL